MKFLANKNHTFCDRIYTSLGNFDTVTSFSTSLGGFWRMKVFWLVSLWLTLVQVV
jgi:hypothetical protein